MFSYRDMTKKICKVWAFVLDMRPILKGKLAQNFSGNIFL